MRTETLTAYGAPTDRDMLAVLAQGESQSASAWLINQIRQEYTRLYGNLDPATLRNK